MLRQYDEIKEEIKNSKNCHGIYYTKTKEKYCFTFKKNAVKQSSSVRRTKQNRLMFLSNCAVRGKKKSRFIKNQEASTLK